VYKDSEKKEILHEMWDNAAAVGTGGITGGRELGKKKGEDKTIILNLGVKRVAGVSDVSRCDD